jgi:protein-disulfide isomerase
MSRIGDEVWTRRARQISVFSLLLGIAVGCGKEKTTSDSPKTTIQDRRIELLIRSQYEVPATYDLTLGSKTKSPLPGYYSLPIRFSLKQNHVDFEFLISRDGNSLARLQTFDLAKRSWAEPSLVGLPVRGKQDAKVTIVVFDDLACPFCARFHGELSLLSKVYKNVVKVVYKPYPLVEIHPWSLHAAVDAGCLGVLDAKAYWNDVNYVHEHLDGVNGKGNLKRSLNELDDIARKQAALRGLDMTNLDTCLKKQDASGVLSSIAEGEKLGLHEVPVTFVNGERIVGAHPATWISAAINRALREEGIQPPFDDSKIPVKTQSYPIQEEPEGDACTKPNRIAPRK